LVIGKTQRQVAENISFWCKSAIKITKHDRRHTGFIDEIVKKIQPRESHLQKVNFHSVKTNKIIKFFDGLHIIKMSPISE